MKISTCTALLLTLPLALMAGVNTIYLKDGRTFSGRFIDGNTGTISFQDESGRDYRFRTGDVDRITFDENRSGYNRSNRQDSRAGDYPGQNGQAQNGQAQMVPSGSEITVRTTNTISSKNVNDNQVFSASVERDVLDGSGRILIPRGSPAELVVRDANGGSSRDSNNLVLDIQAVSVNGQRFLIDTEDLTQRGNGRQGIGANKRTGEFVGGGTALGTLLGAVAGGGKGALIGALAGAAAGAGTQVLTKGSEVRVPSETVLTFRLDRPVYMNSR